MQQRTSNLELAVIGNSRIGTLIDTRASIVWMCVPRFDGDPVFCALLDDDRAHGRFDIELQDCTSITQAYERNTAILRTEMGDARGARALTSNRSSCGEIFHRPIAWSASSCARCG